MPNKEPVRSARRTSKSWFSFCASSEPWYKYISHRPSPALAAPPVSRFPLRPQSDTFSRRRGKSLTNVITEEEAPARERIRGRRLVCGQDGTDAGSSKQPRDGVKFGWLRCCWLWGHLGCKRWYQRRVMYHITKLYQFH